MRQSEIGLFLLHAIMQAVGLRAQIELPQLPFGSFRGALVDRLGFSAARRPGFVAAVLLGLGDSSHLVSCGLGKSTAWPADAVTSFSGIFLYFIFVFPFPFGEGNIWDGFIHLPSHSCTDSADMSVSDSILASV
jgi:hypothetical protein